jgi:hypothetical protein
MVSPLLSTRAAKNCSHLREEDHHMKRPMGVATALVFALGVAGPGGPAEAKQGGGFARLDQVTTPGSSVMCGAKRGNPGGPNGSTFTYHVTMNNVAATAGSVIVRYQDTSEVSYPIAAGGVLHFSGVGGTTLGVDRVIEVTGDGGAQLVGTMSGLFDTGAQPHPDVPGVGLCVAVGP